MNAMFRATTLAMCLAFTMGVGAAPAAASSVADFYRGKELKMIIRSPAGSGYDAYARLLARHIIHHIPGPPSIIVPVNMPGGGGIKAANYVANIAPKDGTVLTIVSLGLPMYQALRLGPMLRANLGTFNWLGSLNHSNSVLVTWHTSPTKTLKDAMTRETLIGATGAGSASMQLPEIYNNILGTKFKIVVGYRSLNAEKLALERGEIEGIGTAPWAAYLASEPEWIKDHKLNVIIQVGLAKEKDMPKVPLLRDLGNTPEKKAVLEFVSKALGTGWPFAVGPDVPKDRVRALRAAFDATMRDPKFLADAAKQKISIDPIGGVELQELIRDVTSVTPEVRADVKAAIEPKASDTRRVNK